MGAGHAHLFSYHQEGNLQFLLLQQLKGTQGVKLKQLEISNHDVRSRIQLFEIVRFNLDLLDVGLEAGFLKFLLISPGSSV